MVEVGQSVIFVDSRGVEHPALLTAVWGVSKVTIDATLKAFAEGTSICGNPEEYLVWAENINSAPSVNLIIVSTDSTKNDQYGRQIERLSSIVHEKNQHAHGNYWK
jgi:hypothetical protein